MNNAFGDPQTVLLLGGTSDIGLAIVRALSSDSLRQVILACRDPHSAEPVRAALQRDGVNVSVERFDAADTASHREYISRGGNPGW